MGINLRNNYAQHATANTERVFAISNPVCLNV